MKEQLNEILQDIVGLNDEEVIISREKNGSNELSKKKERTITIKNT